MSDYEYGCACHINPPCGFCLSLDEDEADAYARGGMHELESYRATRDKKEDA